MATAITVNDVAAGLRRALTPDEVGYVERHLIPNLTDVVERYYNRPLQRREYTEELTSVGAGLLYPTYGPVRAVASVKDFGDATVETVWWDDRSITVPYQRNQGAYTVTYSAGDDHVPAAVKHALVNAITRVLSVSAEVSSGALGGYSVEGTSITYKVADNTPGGVGSFQAGELNAVRHFKRATFA